MNIDKLMKSIEAVTPGRYGCAFKDIQSIRDVADGDAVETGSLCFRYGFIQGQKAAKAEAKREQKELMERDTSGWYYYLSRWLARNIDNEQLLTLTGEYARAMEERLKRRQHHDH